jgi:hypothetical protein
MRRGVGSRGEKRGEDVPVAERSVWRRARLERERGEGPEEKGKKFRLSL